MVIKAAVERCMIIIPSIITGNHALRRIKPTASFVIQIPREEVGRGVRQGWSYILVPDRSARVYLDVWVGEASNACHGAEVVVEGTILWGSI
jgi:hypothetical protein